MSEIIVGDEIVPMDEMQKRLAPDLQAHPEKLSPSRPTLRYPPTA